MSSVGKEFGVNKKGQSLRYQSINKRKSLNKIIAVRRINSTLRMLIGCVAVVSCW
jgi:hypothetical protein